MFFRPPTCTTCQISLQVHQPDLNDPDRLLGICPGCSNWNLIDIGSRGRVTLTELPRPTIATPRRTLKMHG